MTDSIVGFLQGIPPEIQVLIISMLPIAELRGAIPVATMYGMDPIVSFIICIIGNMLPIPFILWFIKPILTYLRSTKLLKGLGDWVHEMSASKSGKIKQYKKWGLLIFVAIPLPGTGAWTGAVVADFLEMGFKESFWAIFFGVLIAGVIMMFGSQGVAFLISLF